MAYPHLHPQANRFKKQLPMFSDLLILSNRALVDGLAFNTETEVQGFFQRHPLRHSFDLVLAISPLWESYKVEAFSKDFHQLTVLKVRSTRFLTLPCAAFYYCLSSNVFPSSFMTGEETAAL